jgi:peptidoglycan hydrolase-like protein with peptidoglycan-binding domain
MRYRMNVETEPFLYNEDEVNSDGKEYITWLQRSLNKVMGLRLVEDGSMGPATRSAVRSFQQRAGLAADGIVGPATVQALIHAGAASPRGAATTGQPIQSTRPQAPEPQSIVEGPRGQRPARQLSRSGQPKAWEGAAIERARDIADDDMPWNDPSGRSPDNYIRVLDYFNVADPANGRYAPTSANTYCNIYVHDVTRAMRSPIPHWDYCWLPDPGNPNGPLREGWIELNANRTADWLQFNGRSAGWFCIDQRLVTWAYQQHAAAQSLPYEDPAVPSGILLAGSSVSRAPHTDAALLLTDAYVAQGLANIGLPVVIALKVAGGIGHVEMVRPERPGQAARIDPRSGRFLPITSRAGARNWQAEHATWIHTPAYSGRRFYVHL